MELKTAGFHHITMVAREAERTVRFYRDILGLSLVNQTDSSDEPEAHRLYFGDDEVRPGTLLTVLEGSAGLRGHWGVGGVHHLALGVETPEAQLRWKRWLMDSGVPVSGPYDRHWFKSIYFADPDGQILEIATKGPGYAIDEPADALGRTVVLPPVANLRGGRDESAIAAEVWAEPVGAVDPGMRLQGIHHITGITNDIEGAHEFYESTLGLRIIKRTVNQDDPDSPHWFWANYNGVEVAPHSSLTLFGWKNSTYRERPGAGQTHSIAFRASDDEEQLAWRDHLLSLGVEVSPVMDRKYFRSIQFRAPDGQLLEIATDLPGF
jgi:glyoxalase family protein